MYGQRTVSGRADVELDAVSSEGESLQEGPDGVLPQVSMRSPVSKDERHRPAVRGLREGRKCS
jgi:hypothetical protein